MQDLPFLIDAGELMEKKFEPSIWVVDGLLRMGRRRISLFNSLPEDGKSTNSRQLAVSVAKGEPFLGRDTRRCPVLYWQCEDEPEDLQESLLRLRYDPKTDERIIIFRGRADQNTLDNFDATLKAFPLIGLVIIETLDDLLKVQDILSNTAAREAFEAFDNVFAKHAHRAACLALHHLKKTENKNDSGRDILGATVLRGRTDAKWYLHKAEDKRRIFEATIRRGRPIEPTYLVFDPESESVTLGETYAEACAASAGHNRERIEADILKYFNDHPGARFEDQCRVLVTGNNDAKRRAFKRLLAQGTLIQVSKGVKGQPAGYVVAEIPTEEAA